MIYTPTFPYSAYFLPSLLLSHIRRCSSCLPCRIFLTPSHFYTSSFSTPYTHRQPIFVYDSIILGILLSVFLLILLYCHHKNLINSTIFIFKIFSTKDHAKVRLTFIFYEFTTSNTKIKLILR